MFKWYVWAYKHSICHIFMVKYHLKENNLSVILEICTFFHEIKDVYHVWMSFLVATPFQNIPLFEGGINYKLYSIATWYIHDIHVIQILQEFNQKE